MNLLVPLDPGVGCVLSGVLAVLFAHAAWHKWRSLALFRAQLEAYRLLPGALLGVAAVVIPLGETLIALGLLVPAARPAAALAGAALLLGYALAMGVNLARGRHDLDCGCAGPAERRPIAAWMLWRNTLLSLVLLGLSRPWSVRPLEVTDLVTVGGGGVALILLYAAVERLLGQLLPRSAALRGAR